MRTRANLAWSAASASASASASSAERLALRIAASALESRLAVAPSFEGLDAASASASAQAWGLDAWAQEMRENLSDLDDACAYAYASAAEREEAPEAPSLASLGAERL